jgi:hypothetical protein
MTVVLQIDIKDKIHTTTTITKGKASKLTKENRTGNTVQGLYLPSPIKNDCLQAATRNTTKVLVY